MKAVYSFWSKPFIEDRKVDEAGRLQIGPAGSGFAGFGNFEDFLNSWILSVELCTKHYKDVELVTDTPGKKILVEELGLPFTAIRTELDDMPGHVSASHWALSKIAAYSIQNEPFVHVDADVYLWKRIPAKYEEAPVFAQNTESKVSTNLHYAEPYFLMHRFLKVLPNGFSYKPRIFHEWDTAISCGVVGGQDWTLIRDVGERAVEVFFCEENREGWDLALAHDYLWGDRAPSDGYVSVAEQYGIAKECWSRGIWGDVEFMFDEKMLSQSLGYLEQRCVNLGYTHLIAGTKKFPDITCRLKERIASEYPRYVPVVDEMVSAFSVSRDAKPRIDSGDLRISPDGPYIEYGLSENFTIGLDLI